MFGTKFARSRESIVDKERPGRHVVATTDATIAAVDAFVRSDRRVSISDIVQHITTWVHHYQPETKQASRQWKHKESPTLTKFKVVPSASKVMATVFWDMRGVLLVEFQEHGRTVKASSYCSLLERLKTAIRTKRKGLLTQGVILLHDNARPHTAHLTLETVEQLGLDVLPHPPYSPDLAPIDYHQNARWAEIRMRY